MDIGCQVTAAAAGTTVDLWTSSMDITDPENNDGDGKYFLVREVFGGSYLFLRVCTAADLSNYPAGSGTAELPVFRTAGMHLTVSDTEPLQTLTSLLADGLSQLETDLAALYAASAAATLLTLRKYRTGVNFGTLSVSIKSTPLTSEVTIGLPVMSSAYLNTLISEGLYVVDADTPLSVLRAATLDELTDEESSLETSISFRLNLHSDVSLSDILGGLVRDIEDVLTLALIQNDEGV